MDNTTKIFIGIGTLAICGIIVLAYRKKEKYSYKATAIDAYGHSIGLIRIKGSVFADANFRSVVDAIIKDVKAKNKYTEKVSIIKIQSGRKVILDRGSSNTKIIVDNNFGEPVQYEYTAIISKPDGQGGYTNPYVKGNITAAGNNYYSINNAINADVQKKHLSTVYNILVIKERKTGQVVFDKSLHPPVDNLFIESIVGQ